MTLSRQINEFADVPPEAGMDAGAGAAPATPALDAATPPMDAEVPPIDGSIPDAEALPTGHESLEPEAPEQEGKMAKADLYKLASYSHKLFQQLNDDDELDPWIQAKITKAADYIASVFHYLAYEMKVNEYGKHLDNADTLSEGQQARMKELLSEAKAKVKELKLEQAGMKKNTQVQEAASCEMEECSHCGGTGQVEKAPKVYRPEVLSKAAAYNKKTRAHHAAMKRIEAEEGTDLEEETDEKSSRGGTVTRTADKIVHRAKHTAKGKEDPIAKSRTGSEDAPTMRNHDVGSTGGSKRMSAYDDLDESKPSAGLSKAKKSATVKKAKAGGDIGKPGKGFAKVEKAAKKGGAKDPKAVAAAAMWKNIKEAVKAEVAEAKSKPDFLDMDKDGDKKEPMKKAVADKKKETVKESADFTRMQDQLARLNRSETHVLKESSEADQIRALTKRLLG